MKKGFTLVELLAVIVILGALAAIMIPPVMKNLNKAREESYTQLVNIIEQTTQLYIRDNKSDIVGIHIIGNTVTITLNDLVLRESLKTPVVDPRNDKTISLSTPVNILVNGPNNYTVTLGTIIYAS